MAVISAKTEECLRGESNQVVLLRSPFSSSVSINLVTLPDHFQTTLMKRMEAQL